MLFDLDGTLADTAPDLADAVNRMLVEQGRKAMPLERLRPFASAGARGLLHAAFGIKPDDGDYAALRETFLEYYAESVCRHTRLFPGIAQLLAELHARDVPWGIVTNKATRFTERIISEMRLKPDCVACGDTTPYLKPHPASLLHAAEQLKLPPGHCLYLGDDLRDMKAAQAAGARAIAVEWGYHHPDHGGPDTWQAAAVISHPMQVISLL